MWISYLVKESQPRKSVSEETPSSPTRVSEGSPEKKQLPAPSEEKRGTFSRVLGALIGN